MGILSMCIEWKKYKHFEHIDKLLFIYMLDLFTVSFH